MCRKHGESNTGRDYTLSVGYVWSLFFRFETKLTKLSQRFEKLPAC